MRPPTPPGQMDPFDRERRLKAARKQDLKYAREYKTLGCGPGRHDYPGDPNDLLTLLTCVKCGAVKKQNFRERDLDRAIALLETEEITKPEEFRFK